MGLQTDVIAVIQGAEGDIVFGTGPSNDGTDLTLAIDGRICAAINTAFPVCDDAGRIHSLRGAFRVQVPEVAEQRQVVAEIMADRKVVSSEALSIAPIIHANGIAASEAMALHRFPLAAINGFAVHDGCFDITGMALAPAGDPTKVSVLIDDLDHGFHFLYPLPSAQVRPTYWYWPNSDYATFKVSIDLGSRGQSDSPFFKMSFSFAAADSEYSEEKNTFFIPKSLSAYECYPNLERLRRVQRFDGPSGVAVRGYSDCMRIAALAQRFGLPARQVRILDWGCGHGRVIRHLPSVLADSRLHGIDVDADNISWAQDNLSGIDFRRGPLVPPTDYPSAAFDLVYGISVLTHLTHDMQILWLREIRRILVPGGLALLTFAGDTSVAFASRYLGPSWFTDYRLRGAGADLPSGDLAGVIADPHYYRNVKVSAKAAAELCGEYFDVLGILECMFGYQDLAVLRRAH